MGKFADCQKETAATRKSDPQDMLEIRSSKLLANIEHEDFDLILRERMLHRFGHVEHSSGAIRTACDIQIEGRQEKRRPKLTWKKLTEKD